MIGEVEVRPGDIVLGDDDGLVVGTEEQLLEVLDGAEVIQRREESLRTMIAAGTSLFDHLNYDAHLEALREGHTSKLSFS